MSDLDYINTIKNKVDFFNGFGKTFGCVLSEIDNENNNSFISLSYYVPFNPTLDLNVNDYDLTVIGNYGNNKLMQEVLKDSWNNYMGDKFGLEYFINLSDHLTPSMNKE